MKSKIISRLSEMLTKYKEDVFSFLKSFIILLVVISLSWFSFYILVKYNQPQSVLKKALDNENFDASFIYFALTVALSLCFLLLAHFKINSAISNSSASYLLKVDERWSNPECIEARTIIHKLYLAANPDSRPKELVIEEIGKKIKDIHDANDRCREFIILLNFLDFLETIGYLYSKRHLSHKDINELLGSSVIFYYSVFENFIAFRKRMWGDNYYVEIERLCKRLYEDDSEAYNKIIRS